MNHAITVLYQSPNTLPRIPRSQLPALPDSSLDAARIRQKKPSGANPSNQQCLKLLSRNSEQALPSNVIDLNYFRSVFVFPLGYLRGALIAAYRWAQEILTLEERPSSNVDLYV